MRAILDRSGGSRLLVLGWHNVEGSWCFPSPPGAGRRGLEQQLRALRRLATVVPLDAALRDLTEGRPLPPRAVVITFDDGYRDNLTLAAPLLQQLGLPATVFFVPGILSGQVNPWWERLGWAFTQATVDTVDWEGQHLALSSAGGRRRALDRVAEGLKHRDWRQREAAVDELVALLSPAGSYDPGELFLDWEGARGLVRAGVAIGSHSMVHAILSEEPAPAQRADLLESRRVLEAQLQLGVTLLAYPNGTRRDYDTATIAAAEAAGYTHAVTTQGGWNHRATPRYEVRRSMIRPELGLPALGLVARDLLREARR